ncbi:MAG TPA: tryptophan 2,3-dioxygenase family protein [Stellaceae bacterium]|jgi:tryptophan 2,3-dioxygenase|nr:tryptophan 2,3-dioxygenase family protein [Stellaceae bacterium]
MKRSSDAADRNTYATYLQLERLLSAQVTRTRSDDELLFIVMHQSHELWFKLAIHELTCAATALIEGVSGKDCLMAFKRLSRVSEIERLLIRSWDVLTTLTPDEFFLFRETVGRDGASGFQSAQYRVFEFRLGLKYRSITLPTPQGDRTVSILDHAETAQDRAAIEAALAAPSIYDATVDFMSRQGFGSIEPRRDYSSRHQRSEAVFAAWRQVYSDRHEAPELYQLGEKLVDLEDAFRRWRFAHLATVSRVIGISPGTGGSTGLQYLKAAANQLIDGPLYPELWEVRNAMFSRERTRS